MISISKELRLTLHYITRFLTPLFLLLYRFIQAVVLFLKENELLDGMAFCAVFAFCFSLPIAIVMGLQQAGSHSDALVALLGVLFGGGFTMIAAIAQAEPQIEEQHRRRGNETLRVLKDLKRPEGAFAACLTLLTFGGNSRPDYWVDTLPQRTESPISVFERRNLPNLCLPPGETYEELPGSLYDELLSLRALTELAASNLSNFIADLHSWSNKRIKDDRPLLVARGTMLEGEVQTILDRLATFRTRCDQHPH